MGFKNMNDSFTFLHHETFVQLPLHSSTYVQIAPEKVCYSKLSY